MHGSKLGALLAIAAIGAGMGPSINTAYTERRDAERKAQDKALAKKQKVREEIRARRKAKGTQ